MCLVALNMRATFTLELMLTQCTKCTMEKQKLYPKYIQNKSQIFTCQCL